MMQSQWNSHIAHLLLGLDLETADVQWCMNEILTGNAEIEEIKSFLLALKSKGETSDEVGALVSQMYQHCAPISIDERAVDTVGTGGDGDGSEGARVWTHSATSVTEEVWVAPPSEV